MRGKSFKNCTQNIVRHRRRRRGRKRKQGDTRKKRGGETDVVMRGKQSTHTNTEVCVCVDAS